MKKYYVITLLLIFIYTCSDESVIALEPTQELTLKQVNYVNENTPIDCQGTFADFDSQGKIVEVNYVCGIDISIWRTYTYTDLDLISSIAQGFGAVVYEYEDDVLVEMRNPGFELKFTYDDNLMIGNVFQFAAPTSRYNIYEFEDDSYTKLLSITSFDNSSGIDEVVSKITYQYDGNNPVEIYIEGTPLGGSTMEPNWRINIAYDDNVNPYKKGLAEQAFLANETVLRDYVDYNIAFSADNNITSILHEDLVESTSYTITYSYIYNSDLYPTEALIVDDGLSRTEYFYYY